MKTIVIVILLIFSQLAIAQTSYKEYADKGGKKTLVKKAINEIQILKDGVLLVKLSSRRTTIDAIRKHKGEVVANNYQKEQDIKNKVIVNAFEEAFDFCPVYYFYDYESKKVLEKNFNEVSFLTKELKDTMITGGINQFLIAEYGNLSDDGKQYLANSYYENGEIKKTYYGGTNFSFGALVIKDEHFIQLQKPFPYYVRTFEGWPVERKPKFVVEKLNAKLHEFYPNNQ